ncbi:hypothetical protein GDO86_005691 [Hymenochirus boettgeri]|uniref:FYVE, RhoGEF and PH domain-containing protein 6 n=1 Tax=Hymenochirus boettgeri TaxID=247094 RepID=A0A8T2J8E9_9PIPI|nr:hypothetical protein GDO86_005691 [Hymenochirus boettgeri]
MSADLKKPPVAPKPKHVLGQKPCPPPIAPKPDLAPSNTLQVSRKSKPTIAPKPKVLKGSSVPEDKTHWPGKSNIRINVKCKNEILDTEHSSFIIPCVSSQKQLNGDNLPKTQKVIERLENQENKKICGQVTQCTKSRRKQCSQQTKLAKTNQVTLKTNVVGEKVKDISYSVLSNGCSYRCDDPDNTQRTVIYSPCKNNVDVDSVGSNSNFYSCANSFNNPSNFMDNGSSFPTQVGFTNYRENQKCNGTLLTDQPSDAEDNKPSHLLTRGQPPQRVLPVPRPRKLRSPCLVRQDCVENNSEYMENTVNSLGHFECRLKESNGSTLPRDLLNNIEETVSSSTKNKDESSNRTDSCITAENDQSDILLSKSIEGVSKSGCEGVGNFVRCSSLSMSLPKQLKLIYEKQLPLKKCSDDANEKVILNNSHTESSPKIAPKKPQRHSLPAAGLLKKAISVERLNDSSDKLVTDTNFLVKEQNLSSSSNFPKQISEKPEWKLPHPILPYLGNPELLKVSSSSEAVSPATKPRAKSLSSVDMDKTEKTFKENTKKGALRKFLNMKLSVCLIKSDFQKFLSRGSHSSDNGLSFTESPELNNKTRPTKAHSADSYSPSCQKKRKRHRSEGNIVKNSTSLSLEEDNAQSQKQQQSSSIQLSNGALADYDNAPHYEEIPEYENLPYILMLNKSECTPSIYEVEDPSEPINYSVHKDDLQSEPSHGYMDDELGIVHSDEEDIIYSSDEDDFGSDSSKAELDHPEYKQKNRAGKKRKVYHIAKEIMSSEKVFVDALKLLHIDFRYAVAQASRQLGKSVVDDKVLNQILYYLPQLYELNRDMLRELEERMSQWTEQQKISDIFVKKGPYLKMYSTYIREFDRNVTLLDDQCKKNPGFAGVVRDFEMSPRCANLALKHYLLKPVQRIPQYRLLLTDYLKNLSEESLDYSDTQAALTVVIEVANHANDILKQGDNFQKLIQIQYSLSGHHEIVQPGRVFLKEGTLMKLSRKVMQPRMFYLFNDALLYTTPVQTGTYKLNNMLSLAGMKVKKPNQEAYQNELNIESVERSFILSASSASERDDWLYAISLAIEEYAKKKITFNPAKSVEEADPEEKPNSVLGSKAPIWIPDGRATMCMICTSEFTLTWRRHHCRACGKIICQACSANKHSLEYLKNHLARVCDHCFQVLQEQESLCTFKTASPANHRSPSSTLSTVLHSIPSGRKQKKIPAALKVSASTEDSSMSGYLQRSKSSKKQWKQLWFVIKNKVLYTYAASEDIAALESQPLLGFTVKEINDEITESTLIHLLHKNTLFYIFKADDAHTTQRWIEAFQEGTVL